MKVLVTGGTGVVGCGVITELLRRGHTVVSLARHATEEAKQWQGAIVPIDADVTDFESIRHSARDCDAVLHMVGTVDETPDATFANLNVLGTRHMLMEAERARVPRFIFVSSLNAPNGQSNYHRSKRLAERAVREFDGAWTICRPGNVYGPGDKQISVLLQMVRGVTSLVPMIGDGEQPFQPLWWEDAARALCDVVERDDLAKQELDLAGREVTSQKDIFNRFSRITGRNVNALPLPEFLVTLGAKAISLVGWDVPLSDDQVVMIGEGNVIAPGNINALTDILHIDPMPLDDGLRALTAQQPEQFPDQGMGALERKRFWADITNGNLSPEDLFSLFRRKFAEVMPLFVGVHAEPGSSTELDEGRTITLALPMRGHVQVRVTALEERSVVLVTLAGHPIAGAVRFLTEPRESSVRFQIEVYERAANLIDFVAMQALGFRLQDRTWTKVVKSVIEVSGGKSEHGVEHDSESLDDAKAALVGDWIKDIVVAQRRENNA